MSKQARQTIVTLCDSCGEVGTFALSSCDECKKNFCFECAYTRKLLKEYAHSVSCSGSGDAHYFIECDARLMREGNERQAKYLTIERLRRESDAWWHDYKKRAADAERAIQEMRK